MTKPDATRLAAAGIAMLVLGACTSPGPVQPSATSSSPTQSASASTPAADAATRLCDQARTAAAAPQATVEELQQWAAGPVWFCRDRAVPIPDETKNDLSFFTLGAPAVPLPRNCQDRGTAVATNGVDVRTVRNVSCGFPAGAPSSS